MLSALGSGSWMDVICFELTDKPFPLVPSPLNALGWVVCHPSLYSDVTDVSPAPEIGKPSELDAGKGSRLHAG